MLSASKTPLAVEGNTPIATRSPLPRGPVLGWASFKLVNAPKIPSVENLPFKLCTTSGRAAIYHALLQLELPAQSIVLVPTYHCPTMVAPVILANLQVAYFGISDDGLPNLESIDPVAANRCRAMLVSHYFGVGRSLAKVRQWCDDRGIALIEDCAHSYFGQAGERPIGAWGDFSTASLSKFFPVPEGGVLASATRPIQGPDLPGSGWKVQLKGWLDVLELAAQHQRLRGLNQLLALAFRLKNAGIGKHRYAGNVAYNTPDLQDVDATYGDDPTSIMMNVCDMARISHKPSFAALTFKQILPRGRIIANRQRNYADYARRFKHLQGARALFPNGGDNPSQIAPYVFPLWVDDADFVYQALRTQGLPVFRWDRIWPGTPQLEGNVGPSWSRHVVQLLCHQDLDQAAIDRTARAVLALLPINR